eukprot:IDg23370t1
MLVGQSPRGRGRRNEVVLDGLGSGTRIGVLGDCAQRRGAAPVGLVACASRARSPCAQDRLVREIALGVVQRFPQ